MNLPDGSPSAQTTPFAPGQRLPEIVLAGINHTSAPVDLRECLAFSQEQSRNTIKALKGYPEIREILILSTCNRVEIIFATHDFRGAVNLVESHICRLRNVDLNRLRQTMYVYRKKDAVRHLFRVASSLDSMVVGEPQILGQVKAAYKTAVETRATGVILNRLLHKAFSVAKKIRSETGIGDRAVSISYAAVELARKIFGRLEDKTVLLVGAGEMAELAVEHLNRTRCTGELYVANRTFSVGMDLAERFSGKAISFEEIGNKLTVADIIISSTGAPGYVLTRNQVRPIMRKRKNRPLFFIDIAVPRDVDPEINRINNAYVYDIDDLHGVIEENIESRKSESARAEQIINDAVIRFEQWYESLDVVPTIKDLQNKLNAIFDAELHKTMHTLTHLSTDDIRAIERMNEAVIKKILHDPMQFLKNPGSHRDKSLYIDLIRNVFNLEED